MSAFMSSSTREDASTAPAAYGLLAVDFDGTVTLDDTTAALGRATGRLLGYQAAADRFMALSDAAKVSQRAIIEAFARSNEEPPKRDALLDVARRYVDELRAAELGGREWLRLHDCTSGMSEHHIVAIARETRFHDDWVLPTLKRAADAGIAVHVISLNFSHDLLASMLRDVVPPSNIHCSTLDGLLHGGSGAMTTGADKADVFERLRAESAGRSIYVGDSTHDLPCLLSADTGILLGEHSSVHDVCIALGVPVVPAGLLGSFTAGETPFLIAARSWHEIHDHLFHT